MKKTQCHKKITESSYQGKEKDRKKIWSVGINKSHNAGVSQKLICELLNLFSMKQ